jgi:hypothetical protein
MVSLLIADFRFQLADCGESIRGIFTAKDAKDGKTIGCFQDLCGLCALCGLNLLWAF